MGGGPNESHENAPRCGSRMTSTLWGGAVSTAVILSVAVPAVADEPRPVPLKAPPGFEVTLFADDELAHDIFSMTLDSLGRVVVSGPGYVRILLDEDGDGRAEAFVTFADGPGTGAQGLFFHGRDLLCTGDAGLLRYRDRDGDDHADGPPDVFLKLKTGSEHFAHSVQKGPDGWWYLIAGNFAGVGASYATLPSSPLTQVESGVLARFRPDMTGGEIVCDGMRNAYDFAFHPSGDVFTYDSDGEREVSLPWYRPTRVLQLAPASGAGWVTESWKWPDRFPEMPQNVASFGRGSPTGVACYRHRQFPEKYHGALFALDWTFGRVMALPLQRSGAGWSSEPIPFLSAVDDFGFAPTDVEVGPDGSLYVSTGGRGTRGAVFRVRATQGSAVEEPKEPTSEAEKLTAVLTADQPLSSWSRARWEPLARDLGRAPLVGEALDPSRVPAVRVRAVEVVTELFNGFEGDDVRRLSEATSPEVRARAAWSVGRVHPDLPEPALLTPFLKDAEATVRRAALEAMLGLPPDAAVAPLLPALAERLKDEDREVRRASMRIVARLSRPMLARLAQEIQAAGPLAVVTYELGRTLRPRTTRPEVFTSALTVLEAELPAELKYEALRLLELALGDVGPAGKLPAVFDGYTSRVDLSPLERDLDPVRIRTAKLFPTGDAGLDFELGRVIAVLTPFNSDLLDRVLAQVTRDSNPIDDVHWLIVASRIRGERSMKQRAATAGAFARLESKYAAHRLVQDTNWTPRISELWKRHVELDPSLPFAVMGEPEFGVPGHVTFLNGLGRAAQAEALSKFVERARNDPDYAWNSDLVFLLGDSAEPSHRLAVRNLSDVPSLHAAVVMVLAGQPEEGDRTKFLDGLDSSQLEVLTACVDALAKLPDDRAPSTQFTLLRTARRLGTDAREQALREKLMRLLQRNTGQEFDYPFGQRAGSETTKSLGRWNDWLEMKYPVEAARISGGAGDDLAAFKTLVESVDWTAGNPVEGKRVFEKRQCVQCHGGKQSLGPDLAGITRRFSRDDVLTAVVDPNRDVSPRYQATLVQTKAGKVHTGLIIYQSVDGLLMRTGTNRTLRFESGEIEERKTLRQSLMPTGLMKGATAAEVADLYAYLRSLAP